MKIDYDFPWDRYSDQPEIIRRASVKRRLYLLGAADKIRELLLFIVLFPLVLLKPSSGEGFDSGSPMVIGLGVNAESQAEGKDIVPLSHVSEMIEELGVQNILIRVPLADPTPAQEMAELCRGKEILFDLLQDRSLIEDKTALEVSVRAAFEQLSPYSKNFKFGNAVNRRKWGFVSTSEYMRRFHIVQALRDKEFPDIELLGGGVIDFDPHSFIGSLFHWVRVRYDGYAALLYVDRRGAPENKQAGFDFLAKCRLFAKLIALSPRSDNRLVITETNWPLIGTHPFAPAYGECMVTEQQQARFLVRYYLLAMASGCVEAVYWHQLVAPGYGLVDNRTQDSSGALPGPFKTVPHRKREAYFALKTLNRFVGGAQLLHFEEWEQLFLAVFERAGGHCVVLWTKEEDVTLDFEVLQKKLPGYLEENSRAFDMIGAPLDRRGSCIPVSGAPIYLLT